MILKRLSTCFSLSYRLLRVFLQIIYGVWRVSKLTHPCVSIFGSSQMALDNKYIGEADQVALWLVEEGISVLTGGGLGIMQAANCGAIKSTKKKGISSIGIGVRGLHEPRNTCVEEYFELDYFFARKWLLTQYSMGFIVFPGGFGTLDELSEILTLIQTSQMKKVPIVLVGKAFWEPFMQWVNNQALKDKLITPEHVALFKITDNPYQAFCFVRGACEIE